MGWSGGKMHGWHFVTMLHEQPALTVRSTPSPVPSLLKSFPVNLDFLPLSSSTFRAGASILDLWSYWETVDFRRQRWMGWERSGFRGWELILEKLNMNQEQAGAPFTGHKRLLFPCQEQSWCGVLDLLPHIWIVTSRDLIVFDTIACHVCVRHPWHVMPFWKKENHNSPIPAKTAPFHSSYLISQVGFALATWWCSSSLIGFPSYSSYLEESGFSKSWAYLYYSP